MRIVADLHIHSRHSLATSPKLTPPYLDRWARIKGIDLVGTGDCTHPAWLAELREKLEPEGEGFFRLRDGLRREFDSGAALAEDLPDPSREGAARSHMSHPHASREGADRDGEVRNKAVRFVLTGEISTIYSRQGRTRKVHHLVILPDFAAAAAFQARLEQIGNISSDGRPILGVDSRELFARLLDADERSILVPAHIWTPWFSVLGARSGFDSIDECYGDLAPRIGAIETGLSSNPPMNWAVSALDRFAIISNSDAHSPEKLGREATVIDMEPSFAGLAEALGGGGPRGNIVETIEFFPQEGKYHYDGHRACNVVLSPEESARRGGLCPVCGRPLTPGVLRRVSELADRSVEEEAPCPADYAGTNRRPYHSLIPLKEILAELLGSGEGSKKVTAAYGALVARAGSEFSLLLDRAESEIESMGAGGVSGELLAESIGRMRSGRVSIEPGYDGEYGVIRTFAPGERVEAKPETGLFGDSGDASPPVDAGGQSPVATKRRRAALAGKIAQNQAASTGPTQEAGPFRLDRAQEEAVKHLGGPALIVAGPGTGKTAVLALRVARLVEAGRDPSSILALTFTNKAAEELRGRIGQSIGAERAARLTAATFHSFCRSLLRERSAEASLPADFGILDEEERSAILAAIASRGAKSRRLGAYIEERKRFLLLPGERRPRLGAGAPDGLAELADELGLPPFDAELDSGYASYRDALRRAQVLDFDDLVAGTVRFLAARTETLSACRARFRAVFVDEYQDVNFAQYALIRLLAPGKKVGDRSVDPVELCVIGDPNQAIYGFRGSDRRFIDRFLADYPGASVYRLVRSFRCASGIIGAADRLVNAGLEGSDSAVALSRSGFPTEKSEAEGIAREIDRLIGGTRFFAMDSGVVDSAGADSAAAGSGLVDAHRPALRSLGECAILVRASFLAPPIGKALLDHGIPYRLIGEKPWWEEEPARAILTLLRAAVRPEGAAGIGSADALRAATSAGLAEILRTELSGLSPAGAVRAAARLLGETKVAGTQAGAGGSAGAGPAAAAAAAAGQIADNPAERLVARASPYRDLVSFLDDLALGSPQDGYEARSERVSLMTIHAAKGLEFDHVFVAGLEEGILPFTLFEERGGEEDAQSAERLSGRIEEERRLLYVAMTRARVGLYLSWARSQSYRGRSLALPPSRFLSELEDLVPELRQAPLRPRDPQLGLFF